VIGGLISDRFERVDRKIPLLGDIPIVGALFRQFKENSSKTELLIVLTPHVVRSPSQAGGDRARELSDQMLDKLTLPPELLEQIRRGELEGMRVKTSNDAPPAAAPAAEPAANPAAPDAGGSDAAPE
jgi:general secretion pathway protein D